MSESLFFDVQAGGLHKPAVLNAMVAPRPIAWVSTQDAAGVVNLAPFSYFNLLTNSPPTVVFSCVNPSDREHKDTLGNIRGSGEFVVNLVSRDLLEVMHASSSPWPAGQSELDALGIESAPSRHVRPPRVAAAPASFECRLLQLVPVPPERPGDVGATAIIGRIVGLHVAPQLMDERDRFDTLGARLMARIGGNGYVEMGPLTELERVAGG